MMGTTEPNVQQSFDWVIRQDHRAIFDLYERWKQTPQHLLEEKQKIANSLIREVSVHSVAEEITVYPLYDKKLANGVSTHQHSLQEHQQVKDQLYELDKLNIQDVNYNSKIDKIMSELSREYLSFILCCQLGIANAFSPISPLFKHYQDHIREEENTLLPQLRSVMNADESVKLGEQYLNTKKTVPTRPHPSAPTQPTMETIGMYKQSYLV